jgi:hypothetical protein
MSRFVMPRADSFDTSGNPRAGGKLYFYVTGTTTPANTYSDSARTIPNANPVVADSAGVFGEIFLSLTGIYKVVLKTSADVTVWTADPVTAAIGSLSAGTVTAASISSVTADLQAITNKLEVLQTGTGAVSRTVGGKLRGTLSPKDFGALGDGVTNDSAAFTLLEAAFTTARNVDLEGVTYLVTAVPTGHYYTNGYFIVGATTYSSLNASGISAVADTGVIDSPASGTYVLSIAGRTNKHLFVNIASQNSRARGPARAANVASINCDAKGNVSGNYSARLGKAYAPQSVNIASEEGEVYGFRGINAATIYSRCEYQTGANLASRLSVVSSEESANIACNNSTAGYGRGARLSVTVSGGAVTAITVDAGGTGYNSSSPPTVVIYDRVGSGTGATATATVVAGVITAVAVGAGGSSYSASATVDAVVHAAGDNSANVASTSCTTQYMISINAASNQCTTGGQSSGNYSSDDGTASGAQSANVATNDCVASGANNSANIASTTCTASGTTCSANVASETCTASGSESANIASSGSTASGSVAAVIASNVSTASAANSLVLGGRRVLNSTTRSVAGGNAASGVAATANRTWHIFDSGNVSIAGTLSSSVVFADYAEYFENLSVGVIGLGAIVTLVGGKIRPAGAGDRILGTVSGTAALALGDSPFSWSKRFLTGEFGEELWHDVADEETGEIMRVRQENPAYNPATGNVPRSERPAEWSCVAMIGQVHVRVKAGVGPQDFVAADGSKSATETRLECMKIKTAYDAGKGYAVAICLLR